MTETFSNLTDDEKSDKLLSYAKGRLSEASRIEIDAVCAKDPSVASELAYYQALSKTNMPKSHATAKEKDAGWDKISRAIKQEEFEKSIPVAANDNTRFWRSAAAVLGIILLSSASFNVGVWNIGDEEAKYTPVGQELSELTLKVVFRPSSSEREIREFLLGVDGEIVSGPSALGLYSIRFDTVEKRNLAVSKIQENETIIDGLDVN